MGVTLAKCERLQRKQSDYVAERQIMSATGHYWPRSKRCYAIQGQPGQKSAKTPSPLDVMNSLGNASDRTGQRGETRVWR